MSPVPSVSIPGTPMPSDKSSTSTATTVRPPRSVLKNLFTWKRTPAVEVVDVALPTDHSSILESTQPQVVLSRKPSFSCRSRSDTSTTTQKSRTRSKSRRRSRSRCRAIWDPPPLFQAYNQSYMHDVIQIPTRGFLDWFPRNSSNRSSAKIADTMEDEKVDAPSPSTGHRRSMSDSSTSSLSKKLFFLFENGHILQYKAEGSQDRLPERVLELSRESVAFASDAVLGQHWVLEICPHGRIDDATKANASRSAWSRISLKTQDAKRMTEKLLLVFDSPDALFTWLIAIRKQIEGLGGLEYQPGIPPVPPLDTKRQNLRHTSSEYFKRKNTSLFSRSSSALPLQDVEPAVHEKDLPQLPTNPSYQPSISTKSDATSSVGTITSLDRLRESYSGSSTAGTIVSSRISAASMSPTKDNFPAAIRSIIARDAKSRSVIDRSIPRTPTSPLHRSEERPPSPADFQMPNAGNRLPVLQKSLDESFEQPQAGECKITTFPSRAVAMDPKAESSGDQSDHVSDPAAVLEFRKRLRQAKSKLSITDTEVQTDLSTLDPRTFDLFHPDNLSMDGSLKAPHGLFLRHIVAEPKNESRVFSDQENISAAAHSQAVNGLAVSVSPVASASTTFATHQLANTNLAIKRPKPIALPQFLVPVEIDSPMRTPAVTDAMLDTNFGTISNGAITEPSTPIVTHVPDFTHIKIDSSMYRSLREIEARTTPPPPSPEARNLTPRRSLPNFQYGTVDCVSAPVGPPPSCPLPAVPPTIDGRSSRSSTPNKRASIQSSGNRRASTKPAANVRKSRSRATSFSPQPAQGLFSLSSATQSTPLGDISNISTAVTSLQSEPEPVARTIGQVYVVPIPPPASDAPLHQRSSSTSSAKSHRLGGNNLGTISNKPSHSTMVSLPSLSHLIRPPCGFEPELDYADKGCFGISTPRSGVL